MTKEITIDEFIGKLKQFPGNTPLVLDDPDTNWLFSNLDVKLIKATHIKSGNIEDVATIKAVENYGEDNVYTGRLN